MEVRDKKGNCRDGEKGRSDGKREGVEMKRKEERSNRGERERFKREGKKKERRMGSGQKNGEVESKRKREKVESGVLECSGD